MPNVSQLAAMYGGNPQKPNIAGKPTAVKKWPQVNTSGSTQPVDNEVKNDWRAELERKKKLKQEEQNPSSNSSVQSDTPKWQRKTQENVAVNTRDKSFSNPPKPTLHNKPTFGSPSSMQNDKEGDTALKPRGSFLNSRNTQQQNSTPWNKQKTEESKSEQRNTAPWNKPKIQENVPEQRNVAPWVKQKAQENASAPAKPNKLEISSVAGKPSGSIGTSTPSRNGSVISNRSWKASNDASGGHPLPPQKPASHDHSPADTAQEPLSSHQTNATERHRRPLPPSTLNRPPPAKPGKNFNIILPGKENSKSTFLHSNGQQELPPTPPSTDRTPSGDTANFSKRTPSFLTKQKGASQQPSLPALPNRPALPPPGGNTGGAPALPSRDNDLPPPLPPASLRGLPPPPGGRKPSVISATEQLPIADDVYDDTDVGPNPALPARPAHPPLNKRISSGAIATWDDEEEALYDETPDGGGAVQPPPRPGMARGPQPPDIIPDEERDEMYEDLDQYSKFKGPRNEASNNKSTKEDDKKKKEAEKKDKEIRKKFKLPKEGEIAVESQGVVKSDARGFALSKDLSVHANESVDIIRMNDNPKSKWLVRNREGAYGYVDSDNIDVDMKVLRQTMQSVGSHSLPPPVPGSMPSQLPTPDENVYDETPEDLYEEL